MTGKAKINGAVKGRGIVNGGVRCVGGGATRGRGRGAGKLDNQQNGRGATRGGVATIGRGAGRGGGEGTGGPFVSMYQHYVLIFSWNNALQRTWSVHFGWKVLPKCQLLVSI